MTRVFITFMVLLGVVNSYSQSKKAIKYYEQGTRELSNNNPQKAIKLFNLSLDEEPSRDSYFNRGLAYKLIGDSCQFCQDMQNANRLGDMEAGNIYKENCTYSRFTREISDSIKQAHPNAIGIEIVHQSCKQDSAVIVLTDESSFKGQQKPNSNKDIDISQEDVFSLVEEMPEFPGGSSAMLGYIAGNIVYPKDARENNISGTVYVSFIVSKDGYVSNVEVIRGIHWMLDNEAKRVIASMPQWNPGKQNGNAVHVRLNLPVRFAVEQQKSDD